MNFTNLAFLPFVFIVCLLYFTVFAKKQWICLLIASVIFYLLSGPQYIVYILITCVSTYLLARGIGALHKKEKDTVKDIESREEKKKIKAKFTSRKKCLLILDLIINLGILCVLKYTDFALSGVTAVLSNFGIDWSKQFEFVLPLGISFYTFMSVGYILDVYWKRYEAEKNIFHYATFTFYFPQIIQGPIARYNKLAPQLFERHKFDYNRLVKGIQLMLWGYFEKLVIADRLAIFADNVYSDWKTLTGLPLIIAIIFFSMRLYLDFQGCMDIARGVSQILGIDLELNFWHPYFSKTMPEFWRRWHITLGAWFKDYLLYPVSMSSLCKSLNRFTRKHWGNNASRAISTVIPAACVWLITGLWHGASSGYLFWGIYHGILIISGALFEIPIQKLTKALKINTEAWSFKFFQMARTFVLSAIGRIFFVSDGFIEALRIIKRTFSVTGLNLHMLWDGSLYEYGLDRESFLLAILLIFLIWCVSMLQEKFMREQNSTIRDELAKQNVIFKWALTYALIFGILIFGVYGSGYDASAFVYGQF